MIFDQDFYASTNWSVKSRYVNFTKPEEGRFYNYWYSPWL